MEQFTNRYSLQKTLRFELKPHELTKILLEHSDFIAQDEHRSECYKLVKKIIDRYHKAFIEDVLSKPLVIKGKEYPILQYSGNNKNDSLEEFYALYIKKLKTETEKSLIKTIQESLRKQIVKAFTSDSRFKRLDKKELLSQDIYAVAGPEEHQYIKEFDGFATYFAGFHENRMNMYSADAKSTAIGYRLINENLPKFIDNMGTFQKLLKSPVSENFETIYKEMEHILPYGNIEEFFMLHNYPSFLTQKQITIYNAIIGGRVLEDGTQIKGINQYVNLYNKQPLSRESKLPKLKTLYKQILSDKESVSWLAEEFTSDEEMLKSIRDYYTSFKNNASQQMIDILTNIKSYDIDHIFIPNDISLTTISKKVFKDWEAINKSIIKRLKEDNPQKGREKDENYEERMSKAFKSYDSFSLGLINSCTATDDVCIYFSKIAKTDEGTSLSKNLFDNIEVAYNNVKKILNDDIPASQNLAQDKATVQKIKTFLDTIKELQKFIKPLLGSGKEADKDERFYGDISEVWEVLDQITPLYNKVRNRMTRKPYSKEKIKINFNIKGNFLGGWVDSKTEKSDNGTQYGGYLFRKRNEIGEYDYYLGVSTEKKLFRQKKNAIGKFERLDYYQPKSNTIYGNSYKGVNTYEEDKRRLLEAITFFVEKNCEDSLKTKILKNGTPSSMINSLKSESLSLYNQLMLDDSFSVINKEVTNNLHKTIIGLDRIPRALDYKDYHFTVFTEPQQIISEICNEKVFRYFPINDEEMEETLRNEKKPFLLFKITNKDLSYAEKKSNGLRNSRGKENLHTMYFKRLMEGDQKILDIGTAEMFFRRASLRYERPTHPANAPIQKKNPSRTGTSMFNYDIIKDKRFTVDKFGLHLSIILNYQSPKIDGLKSNAQNVLFNNDVRRYIKTHSDIHFIGIDRGERHLLYVSVIDSKGRIKEQFSLNQIINEYKGNSYNTDYHKLLEERDEKRTKERQSWDSIESIKELKQGYLSQVIHKIASLVVKYNAVVVLEDLNIGFKRGRQKVESSIYQQFEKALIDKFNYLVDKNVAPEQPGGLMKGYQLTNKFSSFRDMGKQNGFLFYIPAWNTSKIDPVTGFIDMLHPKYESAEKAREFFSKFNKISYNQEKGWFEFLFDYNDFTTKAEGTRTVWTLCTFGKRIETFRNKDKNSMWDNKEIDLTSALISLCEKYDVPLSCDMKNDIIVQIEKDFYVELTRILRLTLQMRNSITGTDVDYLISPVADENGNFYDSRNADSTLPDNADANGAYNIARKGLWAAMQIRSCTDPDLKVNLAISNKEWLTFAQTKPYTK